MESKTDKQLAGQILSVYGFQIKKSDGESEPLRDFHGKGEFDADGLEPTKIVKAEGDHGGVIIGHTGSGKPIYQDHNHPSHSSFTRNDHLDAAASHEVKRKQHFNNTLAVDKKIAQLPDEHLFTDEHHKPLEDQEKHEWQLHKDRKESTDHHLRQALNS